MMRRKAGKNTSEKQPRKCDTTCDTSTKRDQKKQGIVSVFLELDMKNACADTVSVVRGLLKTLGRRFRVRCRRVKWSE